MIEYGLGKLEALSNLTLRLKTTSHKNPTQIKKPSRRGLERADTHLMIQKNLPARSKKNLASLTSISWTAVYIKHLLLRYVKTLEKRKLPL